MVDVLEIYEAAIDSEAVRDVAGRFMRLRSAQAVTVRILPWLLLDSDRLPRLFGKWGGPELADLPAFYWETGPVADEFATAPPFGEPASMAEIFDRLNRWGGFEEPFQVTLHINRERFREDERSLVNEITSIRRVLVTAEWRPPARLQLAAGDVVCSGKGHGTLGGFIIVGPQVYGVTCAHVVDEAEITDRDGRHVGTAQEWTTRDEMGPGTVCNPMPLPGEVQAPINATDFALVQMHGRIARTGLSARPVRHLGQFDLVDVGSTARRFSVRSLCYAMNIQQSGVSFCFAPLLELFSGAGTTRPGDSGSWVVKDGAWAGMVVGADQVTSFAIDARRIAPWIDASRVVQQGAWSVW